MDREPNRTFFLHYIKAQAKWLFMILLSGFVMSVLTALNKVPSHEILYGMGLCLFLLFCAVAFDYQRVYRKCRALQSMETSAAASADFVLDGLFDWLETSDGPLETQYQRLLMQVLDHKAQMRDEMELKSKELKEYYTMWVHQIKTPISAMRLLLQEKNGEIDLSEELDELFDIERYVEMALQYMRMDSESTDYLLRLTQLDGVVREVVHKYARLFIRGKIRLDYRNVGAWAYTDEKWLAFVLEQVFSNAVKYTPQGTVSIFMETAHVLAVADNGIGIRPEDLPRVFEKGYTGYNGHADKSSTGIGLYLCSRIMKKLGHGFTIESEPGKGTKVLIAFPQAGEVE